MALDVLKACGCNQDPEKDGCYRCLYAYRNNYERNNTSRDTAIELLSEILKYRDRLVKTDSLKNVSINPLLDSELEERFIEALRSFRTKDVEVTLRQEVVKGKPGWYLKVNDRGYFIVPQVELGHGDGVVVPSRADFVFYPELSRDGKPVVVFTDGFMYHAGKGANNRIGKDVAQRMAIARSDKYVVWSLAWDDVENSIHKKGGHYDNFLADQSEKINGLHAKYNAQFKVKQLGTIRHQSSFDMLMTYLANPDSNMWRMYALIHGLVHLDCVCKEEEVRSVAERLWEDLSWHDVQLDMKLDKSGSFLGGLYQKNCEDSPLIKLVAYIGKDEYGENRFHKISIICRFFDDDDLADKTHFKGAWNGFIRMYNVYQFIPNAVFITTKGISEGQYLWLMTDAATQKDRMPDESDSLAALQAVTDAYIHPFLSFLVAHGLPLPEPGFELCDEKDEIIATAELGWPDKKIAFLKDYEKEYEQIFDAKGWRTMALDAVIADPAICVSMLK
jgi:DEAD/DEAH box helicase domain-containing protein